MNKSTKIKPIRDEQALNDLKCRAESSDQQAQFDLEKSYATASLNPTFAPAFETTRRRESCISMEKAFEWWLKMLSRNTLPSGTMTAPPL